MKRPAAAPSTAPRHPAGAILAAVAAALTGLFVFRGAAAYFFGQDDFLGLARAQGLAPRLEGAWRWLSGQAYFDALGALAGPDPLAYHLTSLAAHALGAALLTLLLTRRMSAPAALVGGVFFATHPAIFTAVYSVSGIGEILALLFALLTLAAAGLATPWRWLALPAFALSLISKEATLLLPLALYLGFGVNREAGNRVRPVAHALALMAAAYVILFLRADVFGVGRGLDARAAYAMGGPADMGRNLLTYLGWTLNMILPLVRGFSDVVDPAVFPYGVALAGLWLAGLASPALRARGWLAGGVVWLALVAPVLPLRNHTYHYYLLAPLAGAAWCAAAAFDAWPGARPGRAAWIAAGLVAAGLALNGAAVVGRNENAPLYEDLRADPTVDRARIAGTLYESLRGATLPETLWFWSPALEAGRVDSSGRRLEVGFARNVQTAVMDGLGIRVLFPEVRAVHFLDRWAPVPAAHGVVVYRRTGQARLSTPAAVDSLLRAHPPEQAYNTTP